MLLIAAAIALQCQTVSGTYAIYANHDLLHIDGSSHLIEVTSAKLDAQLERRGWEQTVARGRFTICGPAVAATLRLRKNDEVSLRSWSGLRFIQKSAR
jgi:hypothetical protein